MKDIIEVKTCPKCQKIYAGIPSVSRFDNETLICQDCGTRESLKSLGIDVSEQEKILETIHKYS